VRCPLCKMEFENSVKTYRKFYFKGAEKTIKVAYKEERCPYCGYPIKVEEVPYDSIKIKAIKSTFKDIEDTFRKEMERFRKAIKEMFDYICDDLESFLW